MTRSLQELFERQASAARAISGADHSSFTGVTTRVEQEDGVACTYGMAYWNGDIGYDDSTRATLQEMFDTAGQQHDFDTLVRFRHAVRVVLHENSHLLAGPNTEWSHGTEEYQTDAGKALEEGVTEAWSFDNLSRYITELGLDEIAPGINDVEGVRLYPQYHPAATRLCEGLAEFAGRDAADVMTDLNNTQPGDKWRTAVDLLWNNSGMPDRFSGRDADETKAEFAAVLRTEFGNLKHLVGRPYAEQAKASAEAGERAVATVVKRIRKLELAVPPRGEDPARAMRTDPSTRLWASGSAPPRRTSPPRLGHGVPAPGWRGAARGGGQHRE